MELEDQLFLKRQPEPVFMLRCKWLVLITTVRCCFKNALYVSWFCNTGSYINF